jgi:hypothetical protein
MTVTPTTLVTVEHVAVKVPSDAAFRSVVRLVVGGIASRCDLPFERVDDWVARQPGGRWRTVRLRDGVRPYVFIGPAMVSRTKFASISDGLSNTLFVGEKQVRASQFGQGDNDRSFYNGENAGAMA